MPKFEVEVSFFVVADDIDDAFDKTKAWLDRQSIEESRLESIQALQYLYLV